MDIASRAEPTASIIITSYNYGRFLGDAIESALEQTYPNTEVIVVDDGSTDDSRQIIAAFGDRVVAVLKENGGMASAFNSGFAASGGDLICFLDADDIALPERVATAMAAWRQHPDSCLVYHQLQHIDTRGTRLNGDRLWPGFVLTGDIRDKVERSGGWWPCAVTSGLCFARPFLERVLPVPEADFKVCAESYLVGLAPFFGSVVGIRRPLTSYRLHGSNYWTLQFAERQAGYRRKAEQYAVEFSHVQRALHEHLGQPAAMALSDHYLYQYHRRKAGDAIPLRRIMLSLMGCPLLPPRAKVREAVRMLRNRL